MRLTDFHFDLPKELIARYPLEKRSASRLLHVGSFLHHLHFEHVLELVSPHDLLVFNQSRVIPARLFGQKETGGRVEILVERVVDHRKLLVHLRASKTPLPGGKIHLGNYVFTVLGRQGSLFLLQSEFDQHVMEVVEILGEIPLPPYMERSAEEMDKDRYQTVYAADKGSVAAPTAGLHFDELLMDRLRQKGAQLAFLTLHVGAGTFLPVRTDNIREHHMHPEYVYVPESVCEAVKKTHANGGRVIAVGTTSARSLESAAAENGEISPFAGDTNLFIYPGYKFKCVDALITNFHLPESSLLMLVCALGGYERVMAAYREAVSMRYRFYSYGDAMFIEKPAQSLSQ